MADIEKKSCRAADGVTIVYSAAGSGEPGLVFIHGGLAERSFWDAQIKAFSSDHRVVALDLPGHGESGSNRKKWGIPEFGADVSAVVQAEEMKRVVLIGNSLGGPVAVEAALRLPGQAVMVVGVDTFQSFDYTFPVDDMRKRAEAFRSDYTGSMKAMVRSLFHPDADPALISDAERRMAKTPPDAAYSVFLSMGGYDSTVPAGKLNIPLRAINGDLYPTEVDGIRKVKADFRVKVMTHMGHYPMIERPDEFNRLLAETIASLPKQ